MKLTIGINSGDDIKALIEAGGDEFFVGLSHKKIYLNARPPIKQYNISNFEEFKKIASIISEYKKSLFLVLNEPYEKNEIPQIIKIMDEACENGATGFIISSIPLLQAAFTGDGASKCVNRGKKKYGKIILSCLGLALNEGAISLYSDLGVERIILTRQNSMDEIKQFIEKFPQMEFESFGFFDKCNNLDELCRTTDYIEFKGEKNKKEGCICLIAKTHEVMVSDSIKLVGNYESEIKKRLLWRVGCSGCFIKELMKIKVSAIKLASRGWSFEKKLKVTKMLSELRICSEDKIIEKAKKEFKNIMGYDCSEPYDCYYR